MNMNYSVVRVRHVTQTVGDRSFVQQIFATRRTTCYREEKRRTTTDFTTHFTTGRTILGTLKANLHRNSLRRVTMSGSKLNGPLMRLDNRFTVLTGRLKMGGVRVDLDRDERLTATCMVVRSKG